MESNSCVSSGKTSRALIVEVKSAILRSTKKKNNIFVKVEINQQVPQRHNKFQDNEGSQFQPLKTRMVTCIAGSILVWDQKFVFYLPHQYYTSEKNAYISFKICMKQKFLPDALLGVAQCSLENLLSQFEEAKTKADDYQEKENIREATYDTEDDEYYYEDYSSCSSNEDDSEIDEQKQQQEAMELKTSAILEILKGEVSKGKLSIDATTRSEYFRRVGDFKWQNFAMDYDEFMMEHKPETEKKKKKQPKTSLLMCFRNMTGSTND